MTPHGRKRKLELSTPPSSYLHSLLGQLSRCHLLAFCVVLLQNLHSSLLKLKARGDGGKLAEGTAIGTCHPTTYRLQMANPFPVSNILHAAIRSDSNQVWTS
eukprot:1150984-Pelagomonas_calceolata.AAC.2